MGECQCRQCRLEREEARRRKEEEEAAKECQCSRCIERRKEIERKRLREYDCPRCGGGGTDSNKYGSFKCSRCGGSGKSSTRCYLSSACIEGASLDDKCEELERLRDYRDNWLAKTDSGGQLIREYYLKAPSIVDRIRQQPNVAEIWRRIYQELVVPTDSLIQQGRFEEARDHYLAYVKKLGVEFLI